MRDPAPGPPAAGQDSLGVGRCLAGGSSRFDAAAASARVQLEALERPKGIDHVLLLSSASSRPAADGLVAVVGSRSRLPLLTWPGGALPDHVGPGTLVVSSSTAPPGERFGDEGELVLATAEALRRGADVIRLSSGPVLSRPGRDPLPAPPPEVSGVPERLGEPDLPEVLVPVLVLLPALCVLSSWAGLATGLDTEIEAAVEALRVGSARIPAGLPHGSARSEPDAISRRIGRTILLVEGASGVGAAAARSWKRSWNLLAKAPAFVATGPDVAFEDVSGFGQQGDVTRQLLTLVSLRTSGDGPGDALRSAHFADIVGEALAAVVVVEANGTGALAQLADLHMTGLAAASLTAMREGIDPGPLAAAEEIRRRLGPASA